MAQIPGTNIAQIPGTIFTSINPPAHSGAQPRSMPDYGAVAREKQRTAKNISDIGIKLAAYARNTEQQEMAVEYSEKARLIDEAGWAAQNAVTGDDEVDRKVWEEFETTVAGIKGSSEWKEVNDKLEIRLNKVSPGWEQSIYTSSLTKRRENALIKAEAGIIKSLENGFVDEAIAFKRELFELGAITKAEYDIFKETAPMESELLIAARAIEEGNVKAAEEMLEKLSPSDMTPSQRKTLQSLKDEAVIAKSKLTVEQMSRLSEAAANPATDVVAYEMKIQQSDALSPEQKITAMKKYRSDRSAMSRGASSAYTTTQSPEAFGKMRDRVLAGTATEIDIRAGVGPGGYSLAHESYLLKLLKGDESSAKALEDSAAGKNLSALIGSYVKEDRDPELSQFANQRGLGFLNDYIRRNPGAKDRDKKEEALRISRNLEKEYDSGTLEQELEKMIKGPLPLFGVLKPSGFINPNKEKTGRWKVGDTATNPKTGKKIRWNGTKWVTIQ